MNALGKQLLMELKDCNKEILNDIDSLKGIMLTAANEAGATVLGESFHRFSPQGISGVIIIEEIEHKPLDDLIIIKTERRTK